MQLHEKILPRNTRSLQIYLKEVRKHELISGKDEVSLIEAFKKGDTTALEKLIKSNLRFVISVAKQYMNKSMGLSIEDLINEGNVGLVKAAERFDETRGFKFISYAVWWIRQSIIAAINEQARIVRLPSNRVADLSKIRKALIELEQTFNREPTNRELSQNLKIARDEIADLRNSGKYHVSLDAPASDDETSGMTQADRILRSGIKVDAKLSCESLDTDLARVIASLDEKERKVLKLYYGFESGFPLTLEEIGNRMDLTRERVRQIKKAALEKMRKNGRSQLLRTYL